MSNEYIRTVNNERLETDEWLRLNIENELIGNSERAYFEVSRRRRDWLKVSVEMNTQIMKCAKNRSFTKGLFQKNEGDNK